MRSLNDGAQLLRLPEITPKKQRLQDSFHAQVTCRRCKGSTLEDMEGFPEMGEMEPIEIEEFEEVEFEPRMQRWGSDLGSLDPVLIRNLKSRVPGAPAFPPTKDSFSQDEEFERSLLPLRSGCIASRSVIGEEMGEKRQKAEMAATET